MAEALAEPGGHCLCGKIKWQAKSAPKWTALCHCESCRRSASAPVVAWMGFEDSNVRWEGERKFYQSSEIARRGFCADCGSQMSFESTRWPGEIHLYAASLDEPDSYQPQLHCHAAERLSWVNWEDELPKYVASAGGEKENK